ncbi:MAG: bifunctional nuclease family protein [bacterium]
MSDAFIPVRIVGIMPAGSGMAVFLGNEEKTFSLHVDHGIGMAIAILLKGEKRERPLTHDLIGLIFLAFGITVERILINDLRNDTYFARIVLKAENEIHKKITEIDARPSDCLAIALQAEKPILVARSVWDQVTDIGPILQDLKKENEENDEPPLS